MGILIYTTFETKEGVEIQSVYSRITTLQCEFRGPFADLTIAHETYLSRDKRLNGYDPIRAPTVEYRIGLRVPHDSDWGCMSFLYSKLKERLLETGLSVDDVFEAPPPPESVVEPTPEASQQSSESTQTTLPTPPPPSEPVPE